MRLQLLKYDLTTLTRCFRFLLRFLSLFHACNHHCFSVNYIVLLMVGVFFHTCITLHISYHFRINLENIFTYLAVTCVEIPCSYVAASLVSFSMAMQEYILQEKPSNMVACHHVHAIVMSIMSLVCYVHKAEV